MKNILKKPEYIACFSILVLLLCYIFKAPIIGVADNGDFYRALAGSGLYPIDNQPYSFAIRTFGIASDGIRGFYGTTHTIFILIAVFLNKLFYSKIYFDIRFLSLLYSIMLLSSVFLAIRAIKLKAIWLNWLYAFLVVLIICDVGYLAYFNSMYGEAATYTSFLLAIASFMYLINMENPSIKIVVLFFVATSLFVGAKQQNFPIAILFAILGLRLLALRKDTLWKKLCIWLSILTIFISALTFISVSKEIKEINIHQAVFFGILRDSKTIDNDLNNLGLDAKKFAPLAGTTYYDSKGIFDPNGTFMQKEFFSKISYGKIIRFYAMHPLRFIDKMNVTAKDSFTIIQGYLGNYEQASGAKPCQNIKGIWSSIKLLFPNNIIFVFVFALTFLIGLFYERKQNLKNIKTVLFCDLMLFVFIVGAFSFVLPYIADGAGDLSKHLFLFGLCFDILFITGVIFTIKKLFNIHKIQSICKFV